MSCKKFFHAFSCLLSKSSQFAEPVMQQIVDSYCKPILIYNIAAFIASKAVLSKNNSVWNSALFRFYGVSDEQLLVQLCTNSLPSRTQVSLCHRKFLLACRCVKNGVLELVTTVYGAKEFDDCNSLLAICRLA